MPGWSRSTGSSSVARVPVEIDIASEFRYREAPRCRRRRWRCSSRSRARRSTRWRRCATPSEQGQTILSIVNVPESAIAREADAVLPTLAGPEIGVASTKAFTTQLTVLACLAHRRRRAARGTIDDEREAALAGGARRGAGAGQRGAASTTRRRRDRRGRSPRRATCSTSGAARAIRSPSKARSS